MTSGRIIKALFSLLVVNSWLEQSLCKVISVTRYKEPNGQSVLKIHLMINPPNLRDQAREFKSPMEINKGICPPSLCYWNKTTESMRPKSGLENPFFHGDIVLHDQLMHLDQQTRSSSGYQQTHARHRRATSRDKSLWKNGRVPYAFHQDFGTYTKRIVRYAMKHIEQRTCIRFKEKKYTDKDYLLYINEPGCWSYIGRIGGPQRVSLGEGCEFNGTAIHETAHALGFWHEQSRDDRDDYIRVNPDNIIPDFKEDYSMIPASVAPHRGYPYDYNSIMHYANTTFTSNAQPTFEIIGEGITLNLSVGQRRGLSDLDIAQLNDMYRCNVRADKSQTVCPSGWKKYKTNCYRFVINPKTHFYQAAHYCSNWYSNLLRIDNRGEDNFILSYLANSKYKINNIWRTAGIKYKGKMKWYDSKKKKYTNIRYSNFDTGQPGDYDSLGLVWNQTSEAFTWQGIETGSHTDKYKFVHSFICEKPSRRPCINLSRNDGRDYRGNLSYSWKGITCQMWISQWPHRHNVNITEDGMGPHNFCRNPLSKLRRQPWCYTTKTNSVWQYCDVTPCRVEKKSIQMSKSFYVDFVIL